MRRIALSIIVVAILIVGGLLLAVGGSAATLGLASTDLGAGQAPVAPCGDTSGVTRSYTTSGGSVTKINLIGFPAGCEGGLAEVTITDSAGAAVAAGAPVAISGGAVALDLTPAPNRSQVRTAHIVVAGP